MPSLNREKSGIFPLLSTPTREERNLAVCWAKSVCSYRFESLWRTNAGAETVFLTVSSAEKSQ